MSLTYRHNDPFATVPLPDGFCVDRNHTDMTWRISYEKNGHSINHVVTDDAFGYGNKVAILDNIFREMKSLWDSAYNNIYPVSNGMDVMQKYAQDAMMSLAKGIDKDILEAIRYDASTGHIPKKKKDTEYKVVGTLDLDF